MSDVKTPSLPPLPDGVEPHALALTTRLLDVSRQALLAHESRGMRPSQFRLLSHVPPGGVTVTELSALLSMTKQGVGQFVTQLQETGHVDVTTDDADRRRRVIRRTELGDELVVELNRVIAELERQWAERVGPERYRAFRGVLEQLAGVRSGKDDDAASS